MATVAAMVLINLRAMHLRLGASVIMLVGVASVVAVITGMLALAEGLALTIMDTPRDDRAIVLGENARFMPSSRLSRDHVNAIASAPGVAVLDSGRPAIAPQTLAPAALRGRQDNILKGLNARGMTAAGIAMHPEIRLTAGRMPGPGLFEAMVGRKAHEQFHDADIGDYLLLDTNFEIVGVFESDTWLESGFVVDLDAQQHASGANSVNSVLVQLESIDSLERFTLALDNHATLEFQVLREAEYYARVTQEFSLFDRIAAFVGLIVGVGGLFCILHVTYTTVGTRTMEIATYRALGFGSSGVVMSVLVEAVLVASLGALIGATFVWLLFDGNTVTTGSRDASVVHELVVSAHVLLVGIAAALGMAILGSLAPAIQAARVPLAALNGTRHP